MEDYGEAEEYLEHIADDIPLFTNTREGVFNTPALVPAPMEAQSAVAPMSVLDSSPLRQQLMRRMAQRRQCAHGSVSDVGPVHGRGITELQLEASSDTDSDVDLAVAHIEQGRNNPDEQERTHDKMLDGLGGTSKIEGDDCEVSPHVVQGLVQIMRDGVHEKRKKSTIAMCNLCCGSLQNRQYAHEAGVVPVLVAMMKDADEHMQRLATACVCNLSADPPLKDTIVEAGAIPYLSRIVESKDTSADARAATAHAAATLWSLCVDMDHIKPMVAQDETLSALIAQVSALVLSTPLQTSLFLQIHSTIESARYRACTFASTTVL